MTQFLLRLDDACPTMRLPTWRAIEEALDSLAIRPVVGVIPDNRDSGLHFDVPDSGFWDRVRVWQRKGWSIALHGLHHAYHDMPPGVRSLVGSRRKSEFAGLPLELQQEKIATGMAVMRANGIRPTVFMAPSHTLDWNTVIALREATDIRTITDGFSFRAYRCDDFVWIPQQLWRFRVMPFGLWTVCIHPNTATAEELETLLNQIRRFSTRITSVEEILQRPSHRRGFSDVVVERVLTWLLHLRQKR